jgi:hypothetical protein
MYCCEIKKWHFTFCLFCCSGMGFELRVLCLLGTCTTIWAIPLAHFCFSYFLNRVLLAWDCNPLTYAEAGIIAMTHQTQLLG